MQLTGELLEKAKEGIHCEHCGQFIKLYQRKISKDMAAALVHLYSLNKENTNYQYIGDILNCFAIIPVSIKGGDFAKMERWGLITGPDEPTNKRNKGMWKITEQGRQFIEGNVKVPKYLYIYDGEVQSKSVQEVNLNECLDEDFRLPEIFTSPQLE